MTVVSEIAVCYLYITCSGVDKISFNVGYRYDGHGNIAGETVSNVFKCIVIFHPSEVADTKVNICIFKG